MRGVVCCSAVIVVWFAVFVSIRSHLFISLSPSTSLIHSSHPTHPHPHPTRQHTHPPTPPHPPIHPPTPTLPPPTHPPTPGTLAHELLNNPKEIVCQDNRVKPRRCQIEFISFSAHVDYAQVPCCVLCAVCWCCVLCGCVAVWLCGCVAVWLCGCVAVWLCGCVAMWLCGCVAVWLCGCVAVWHM
jgi:hypothetical protein